jgi:putative zinc finger/helix-turn-helix YgiT family protein
MKCTRCGHQMEAEAVRTLSAEVRGDQVLVQVVAPACSQCGRIVLSAKARRAYHRAASDGYRRAHMLLTTRQIDQFRRDLGMTWKQFAEYVGIGTATLKRWMGGEIQSPSLDALVRLRADLDFARRATDDLLARLVAHSPAYSKTVEFKAPLAIHRRRMQLKQDWAADADYALSA